MSILEIKNLHVEVEGKEIIKGLNLTIKQGEIHAIMGPNGAGKSTLSYAVMGHPRYKITKGSILFDGEDIKDIPPDQRAKKGLFLAFQYPVVIPGLNLANFLRHAYNAVKGKDITNKGEELVSVLQFQKILKEKMKLLGIKENFVERNLNEGFSGGEKKKAEILQLAILEPKFAFLDETDSGLDIDSLKTVSNGINKIAGPNLGIVIVTHYQRILKYIRPNYVHIMFDGKIVKTGDYSLTEELEEKGYDGIISR
ncbi:MAG: Fe-S cluster assembly ATPase SufC [Candidatus Aenigmarchaeota archaeon]|nr:Fe-S cluster assembly ATPase SufC [Candidatus Aenigmarchaeota archaeon]MBU5689078.1 Fe-S cluster assembly ATPase SufC [Candidatus Aenigmarchaeota archaeon]